MSSIIDDTFKVHKVLGQGFTSEVVMAEHMESGYKLAIKIFKPMKQMKLMVDAFHKEVDSMKNFKHPNLVNIIAANEQGVRIYTEGGKKESIMYLGIELAENAELFDFVADPGKAFSELHARKLLRELIAGLESMHKLNICHRDLKTENIFLDGDFNLKLGDFGFSKFMDPNSNDGKCKTQLGTSGYQCPQLLEGKLYDGAKNDIFACGVILFILTMAYPPFREAKKTDNWYRHIYFEKPQNFWMLHSKRTKLSPSLQELISGMLAANEEKRFTIEDIKKSEWYNLELPKTEDFIKEMRERKVFVDARRQKDAEEIMMQETHGGNTGVYRGGDDTNKENSIRFNSLVKELEKTSPGFTTRNVSEISPKNFLKFDDSNLKNVMTYLLNFIISENGKVELYPSEYGFEAEVPYNNCLLFDEDAENADVAVVNFDVRLYQSGNGTIAEFIKHKTTEVSEFKSFLKTFGDKVRNE